MPKRTGPIQKKSVEARLGSLRSDLGALQSELQQGANDVGNLASDRANGVMHSAGDIAARAVHLAEDVTSGLVEDVESWSAGNFESVRGSIRTQPLAAIALSIGIGAVLGAMFLRR